MLVTAAGKSEKEVAEAYLKAISEHQEGGLAVIRELRVFFAGRLAKIQLRDFAGALRTQAGKMKKGDHPHISTGTGVFVVVFFFLGASSDEQRRREPPGFGKATDRRQWKILTKTKTKTTKC